MSMILTARALQIKTGNPLRKLVLVKLADNANDQGESWPSVPYIAEQCEISERSVQNHINALVKMGLVRVESRKSANGLNQSNIYHLCLNATAVSGESPAPCGANPAGGSGANGSRTGAADAPGGANGSGIRNYKKWPVFRIWLPPMRLMHRRARWMAPADRQPL